MLIIDSASIRRAFPMKDATDVMRQALRAWAKGDVYQPMRTVLQTDQLPGFAFIKPALLANRDAAFGLKVITFFPDNPEKGLPAISGFVSLFDAETGVPTAILDGGVITEIRTGAVSAVATDLLARPDAGDLALLGTGVQARAHLLAMATVRSLRRTRVWGRDAAHVADFIAWAADHGYQAEACPTVTDAVRNADLICTLTSSREPLLDGDWVSPGTHINAVGAFERNARELHTNVILGAVVVVDSREEAERAAGDLLIPIDEGSLLGVGDYAELGEVLVGKRDGRTSDSQVTLFESLGLAVEDVASASHIVRVAREQRLGVEVAL